MPTASATTVSQILFTNIGPLTTVWTPPASCTTQAPHLVLARPADDDRVGVRWGSQRCDTNETEPIGDCLPSGSALDALHSSIMSSGNWGNGYWNYYSPASQCPSGYVTVGIAAKGSQGIVSSSGAFVPPVVTEQYDPALSGFNPPMNIFLEILDDGETAIACCPEGFIIGQYGDGCYKEVPQSVYGEKTTCGAYASGPGQFTFINVTYTYNNTVVTGKAPSFTATSLSAYTTQTETLASEIAASAVPYEYDGGIMLVYREADATGTGNPAPTNATGSGSKTAASGSGVGVLTTVWTLAALAGVALAMPW
ncbi:hypothetical protein CSOJ01_09127 [Colletotrichum sojae]|uniref:Uncharacterized protein n=1 Tax=Colletotrichum sojae TaxID=2175907 RepID=A0A8H6MRY6_9PEZI|nr:hypothetical protein CSOJ01_09127 [Colletotrichum sojae]